MGPNMSAYGKQSAMAKKKKKKKKKRGAFVTFLAGDGDYWKGVVGLAKGLRKVGSAYPLVVAVLPDVPEEHRRRLRAQGCAVREIQPVYPPESQTQFAMAYYVINYSKLRIWEFVEYERMVYLDADIQVYENIDHLLDDLDAHAAAQDRVLPAVPGPGGVAGAGAGPAAAALLQRRHVGARAVPGHRQGPPGRAPGDAAHALRGAGLAQRLLPRQLQAHPAGVQPRARHALEAPGKRRGPRQGQGRALLRSGLQAMAVHGGGAQHGPRRHQDAGQEVVGHLQRRQPRLQGPAAGGRRRRGDAARGAPGSSRGRRRRQLLPRAVGGLG